MVEYVAARSDGLERAFRRIALPRFVVAPTGDRAVEADGAGVAVTGGDGLEFDWRYVAFPEVVVAPAGDGGIVATICVSRNSGPLRIEQGCDTTHTGPPGVSTTSPCMSIRCTGTSAGPVAYHRSSGFSGATSSAKVTPSLASRQGSFAVGKFNNLPFRAGRRAPVRCAAVKQLFHFQMPLRMFKQVLSMSRNIEVRGGHCGLI